MLSLFKQDLLKKNITVEKDKLLLAVSGGMDSMVMLHLFLRLKYNVGVAHVDHSTRDGQSSEDADFVKNYCDQNGIEFYTIKLDKVSFEQGNFHDTARKRRYDFFHSIAENIGYTKICTAHHKDDEVETFFINLKRASGLRGLSGILRNYDKVYRPLLSINRKMIEDYQHLNEVQFVHDQSNDEDVYLRNKIRHNLIPVLSSIDVQYTSSISNSINHLNASQTVLDEILRLHYMASLGREGFLIKFDELIHLKNGIEALYSLLSPLGFNYIQAVDLWNSRQSGKQVTSSEFIAIKSRGSIFVLSIRNSSNHVKIKNVGSYELQDGRRLLVESSNNKDAIFFDENPFPLIIRSRKDGDKFKPEGMEGKTKSLKKFIVDEKLNPLHKRNLLIVEKDKKIVSVLGYRNGINTDRNDHRKYGYLIKVDVDT